ncbi:MAG: PDZ domain-containing protein [Planctomycetes bacterium]|nr:PDZ domain-containing protein [Planctomycetota bacterium]
MNTNTSWFTLGAIGIAAAALLTAPATAGCPQEKVHVICKTAVITDDPPMAAFSDRQTIEVRIEDGDISVKVDGEEIPADRIIRDKDGRIIILDEDGNEISLDRIIRGDDRSIMILDDDGNDIEVFGGRVGDGDRGPRFRFRRGPRGDAPRGRPGPRFEIDGPHPKVMLGIHLAEPGKALQRHLGLEPGSTTMISALFEGLPAHDAGLDQFDIITAIDGQTPADPHSIHEALADKEPGETVTLSVIHEGRAGEVVVTLDAFDADAMRSADLIGGGPGVQIARDFRLPTGDIDWRGFVIDPDASRLFRRLERPTRERLGEAYRLLRERAPRHIEERLEQLSDRIDDLMEMLDRLVEEIRGSHEENDE